MNINILSIRSFSYILLVFIAILTVIFLQLPLTSTFGYEFALIFALIFFFLGGTLNIVRKKKLITLNTYFKFSILVLTTPLIVVLLISLIKDICSFWFGISFYFFLSVFSYWISFFLSEIIFRVFNKFQKTAFIIFSIVVGVIPVFEIYFNPQVYFFSPIIGYFPGTIYDEDLNVSILLIIYRTLNIIYFSGFYLLLNRNIIQKKIFVILFLTAGFLFIWFSSDIRFSTSHNKLNKILNSRFETKNFIIHYDRSTIDSNSIKIIALNHEYYFERLKSELDFAPSKQINSYIFNSRHQKKKYFGSEEADIAKPWLYEIYVSKDSWEKTLKHELTHIFSAEIGKGIFRLADSFNPALIEGFAEALDNNYDDIDLHTVAAAAFKNGYKINLIELFSGFNFFKSFSGLSYLYAGSFSKYLIDNFGIEQFSIFYNSGDYQKAFGKSIASLVTDYTNFLNHQTGLLTKEQADFYFARASIFQKVCPRQIAMELKRAKKLTIDKNFSPAEKIYSSILERVADYEAITGLISIYLEQKNYSKAKSLLTHFIHHFNNTPYFYNLKLLEGDANVLTDNEDEALKIYEYLVVKNPHTYLKLLSELRIELIHRQILKSYLEANDSTKFQLLINNNNKKIIMSSILPMISLAERLKIPASTLLESFHSPLIPQSYLDAYVLLNFSKYLLNNGDLINARKLASLALRKSTDSIYYISIKEHFEKCNWFIKNYDQFGKEIKEKNELQ